jgi:hypothetical protein
MKKSILFLVLAFFTIGIFTSCEKEEQEDVVLLSEFVIGEWSSQSIGMSDDGMDDYVRFFVDFATDHYSMQVVPMNEGSVNWEDAVTLPYAGYVVDDEKSMITIDEPQFPGDEPSDETVTFTVEWTEASNVMVWTPLGTEDAPIITWTMEVGN